jgi:hypothetical protein
MDVVVFCDLDSTLADTRHRQTGETNPDWHAYAMASVGDTVIKGMALLLTVLHRKGVPIVLMSSRWGGARQVTKEWLGENDIPYDWLTLPDETPASMTEVAAWKVVKADEWLARLGPDWSGLVFEDSPETADAFEKAGYFVVRVQPPVRVPV